MAEYMDPKDKENLVKLRAKSKEEHETLIRKPEECKTEATYGEKLAEKITGAIATWKFILIQTAIIIGWTSYNVFIKKSAFDPFPFILLNLFLSFQSAYTAPAIMMNQKRQAKNDEIRNEMESDINVKADLEIALLHERFDKLAKADMANINEQLASLHQMVEKLTKQTKTTP